MPACSRTGVGCSFSAKHDFLRGASYGRLEVVPGEMSRPLTTWPASEQSLRRPRHHRLQLGDHLLHIQRLTKKRLQPAFPRPMVAPAGNQNDLYGWPAFVHRVIQLQPVMLPGI